MSAEISTEVSQNENPTIDNHTDHVHVLSPQDTDSLRDPLILQSVSVPRSQSPQSSTPMQQLDRYYPVPSEVPSRK